MYEPSLLNIHQMATKFWCYARSERFHFPYPLLLQCAPMSKRRHLGRITFFASQGGITCQLQLPPYLNSATSFQGPSWPWFPCLPFPALCTTVQLNVFCWPISLWLFVLSKHFSAHTVNSEKKCMFQKRFLLLVFGSRITKHLFQRHNHTVFQTWRTIPLSEENASSISSLVE